MAPRALSEHFTDVGHGSRCCEPGCTIWAPGYAVGYGAQQAAALCSQVRDLDATCDSDPSLARPRDLTRLGLRREYVQRQSAERWCTSLGCSMRFPTPRFRPIGPWWELLAPFLRRRSACSARCAVMSSRL